MRFRSVDLGRALLGDTTLAVVYDNDEAVVRGIAPGGPGADASGSDDRPEL